MLILYVRISLFPSQSVKGENQENGFDPNIKEHQDALRVLHNALGGAAADEPVYDKIPEMIDETNEDHMNALGQFYNVLDHTPQQIINEDNREDETSQDERNDEDNREDGTSQDERNGADGTSQDGDDAEQISEIENMLKEVTNDVTAVMENKESRAFLNRILDESIALTDRKDSHVYLNRINGAVNQVTDMLDHKHSRDLIETGMKNVNAFFVDKDVHSSVTGLVATTHKLAMDPNMRELKKEVLSTLETLIDDEIDKAYLALAVVHTFRTVQSVDVMNLAVNGLKSLNNIVRNDYSRSFILTYLSNQ